MIVESSHTMKCRIKDLAGGRRDGCGVEPISTNRSTDYSVFVADTIIWNGEALSFARPPPRLLFPTLRNYFVLANGCAPRFEVSACFSLPIVTP